MCPYDTRGVLRAGFKFVSAIWKTDINQIDVPDFRDIENEGLDYENDGVDAITPGQQLLTDAIGPYCSNA